TKIGDLDFNSFTDSKSRLAKELDAQLKSGPHSIFYMNEGYYEYTMKNKYLKDTTVLPQIFNLISDKGFVYISELSKLKEFPRRSTSQTPTEQIPFEWSILWKND